VWRAQLGIKEVTQISDADGTVTVGFHPLEFARMKPLAGAAKEGRVNPKGIPVLYVATAPRPRCQRCGQVVRRI
jgi:hypothetical protein